MQEFWEVFLYCLSRSACILRYHLYMDGKGGKQSKMCPLPRSRNSPHMNTVVWNAPCEADVVVLGIAGVRRQ